MYDAKSLSALLVLLLAAGPASVVSVPVAAVWRLRVPYLLHSCNILTKIRTRTLSRDRSTASLRLDLTGMFPSPADPHTKATHTHLPTTTKVPAKMAAPAFHLDLMQAMVQPFLSPVAPALNGEALRTIAMNKLSLSLSLNPSLSLSLSLLLLLLRRSPSLPLHLPKSQSSQFCLRPQLPLSPLLH